MLSKILLILLLLNFLNLLNQILLTVYAQSSNIYIQADRSHSCMKNKSNDLNSTTKVAKLVEKFVKLMYGSLQTHRCEKH